MRLLLTKLKIMKLWMMTMIWSWQACATNQFKEICICRKKRIEQKNKKIKETKTFEDSVTNVQELWVLILCWMLIFALIATGFIRLLILTGCFVERHCCLATGTALKPCNGNSFNGQQFISNARIVGNKKQNNVNNICKNIAAFSCLFLLTLLAGSWHQVAYNFYQRGSHNLAAFKFEYVV